MKEKKVMKYCSNCGQELREDVSVCTNCGHKINKKKLSDFRRSTKVFLILGILAVILLIIVFLVFNQKLSPEKQLNNIAQAVENEDSVMLVENIDNNITETEAEAYFRYINETLGKNEYREKIERIINGNLKDSAYDDIYDGMYQLLEVSENGKQYLLFKNYDINIPKTPAYNYDNYNIDEFTYKYKDENKRWNGTSEKVIDLIPGIYELYGKTKVNENEYDGVMTVDFSDSNITSFNPGYYYVSLTENISYTIHDVDSEDLSIKINGKEIDADFSQYTEMVGPFSLDEDVEIQTTVNIGGQSLASDPQVINTEVDNVNLEYSHNGNVEPIVHFELNHDEDELTKASSQIMSEEMEQEARENFEDNLEENAKFFVEDYIYSLERMYQFEDINEVEDYIEQDSAVYNTLSNNISSGTFDGMTIYSVSTTDYSKNDNVITLTANSERDYDALDSVTTFSTVYTLNYDPEDLSFTIVDFRDI